MKVLSAILLVPLLGLLVLMDQAVAGGSRRSFARHSSRSFALPLVTTNYRSRSSHHLSTPNRPSGLEFLEPDADKIREVQPVNVSDKKGRAYIVCLLNMVLSHKNILMILNFFVFNNSTFFSSFDGTANGRLLLAPHIIHYIICGHTLDSSTKICYVVPFFE